MLRRIIADRSDVVAKAICFLWKIREIKRKLCIGCYVNFFFILEKICLFKVYDNI